MDAKRTLDESRFRVTHSPGTPPLSRRASFALLALVASVTVATEVLLTRLLSVLTWYGLAFLVLSLAMVGLTAGSLAAARAQAAGEPLVPWLVRQLQRMAGGLVLALVVATAVPLKFTANLTSFGAIVLLASAAALPLVAGGGIVARLLSESTQSVASLYAVDLGAAAVGALLPLVLLGPFSAQDAFLLLAVLLALATVLLAAPTARGRALLLPAVLVALLGVSRGFDAGFALTLTKTTPRPGEGDAPPIFETWNPLSYVAFPPFVHAEEPFMWAAPPRLPDSAPPVAKDGYAESFGRIDGEAGTPMYAFRRIEDLARITLDTTSTAHVFRPTGTACVIGVGGGRDLISALLFGHDKVVGLEINPAMIETLAAMRKVSPVLDDPRVSVHVGDGRALLVSENLRCNVLQASLVDTWAATSAGAFAHTESTLYTLEAWATFLDHLEPGGVLTFSRWYSPDQVSETTRLLALAAGAMMQRGAARPSDHVIMVAAARVATVLVSPEPFTAGDLRVLSQLELERGITVLAAPGRTPDSPVLARIAAATSLDALAAAGEADNLDSSPPTDERPFFFQLLTLKGLLSPSSLDGLEAGGVTAGNLRAMIELVMTFFAVALIGAWLLGPTLVRAARDAQPPLPGVWSGVYFSALGAGFMVAEIALVQRMHVVLGHPTWALVIVLAGLLVATGIGSALSPRVIRTRGHVHIAAAVAAVVLVTLPYLVIRPLAAATAGSGFAVRAAWTGATAGLLGLILGMLFPSALQFVHRERGAPVALALNGAMSVLGSVAAILVSVLFGIPASFALAGGIYAVAALSGPARWQAPG